MKMDKMNIKFLSPNETEWKVIKPDSEEQEEKTACDKNKRVLNELLCSSMQMQNIVVLSGSGTSLARLSRFSQAKFFLKIVISNNIN